MNIIKIKLFTSYVRLHKKYFLAVCTVMCLFFMSCSDKIDIDIKGKGEKIVFSSFLDYDWESSGNKVAGAITSDAEFVKVFPVEGGDNLWMHCIVDTIGEDGNIFKDRGTSLKGAPITPDDVNTIDFNVLGYTYAGADWPESLTPDLMNDISVSSDGTGNWTSVGDYFWTNEDVGVKYRFYGYTPNTSLKVLSSESTPKLEYTIPSLVGDQKDILASVVEHPSNYKNTVEFSFKHILTAVTFSTSQEIEKGTIKKISFKNVYTKASYSFASVIGEEGVWENHSDKSDLVIDVNKSVNWTPSTVASGDTTSMMIPQKLPADAQLEVIFEDELGNVQTLTIDIGGTDWLLGRKVNYVLSYNTIIPSYSGTKVLVYDHINASSQNLNIVSYGTNASNAEVPMRWHFEFKERTKNIDGSWNAWTDWSKTYPSWVECSKTSGMGGKSGESVSIKAIDQLPVRVNANDSVLRTKGAVSDIDLSKSVYGSRTTANCYVVNGPGTYKFPLVYGCAIRDGVTNIDSYKRTRYTSINLLSTLKNHLGNDITDPWISKNAGCEPDNVCLLWQDAPGLVSGIELATEGGEGMIKFEVPAESIKQGNAVVAVRDASNNIMWSWHIWVTDCELNKNDIYIKGYHTERGTNYNLLPRNVGQCTKDTTYYCEREFDYRLVFTDLKQETTAVKGMQKPHSIEHWDNSTYYQWGRKDPMLPIIIEETGASDKLYEGDYSFSASGTATYIKETILNPTVYYDIDRTSELLKCNLWTMTQRDNNIRWWHYGVVSDIYDFLSPEYAPLGREAIGVKTIYDPSPPGYMVTFNGVWTASARLSVGTSSPGYFAYDINANNTRGYHSSAISDNDYSNYLTRTFYIPALGYRDVTGAINDTDRGYYWANTVGSGITSNELYPGVDRQPMAIKLPSIPELSNPMPMISTLIQPEPGWAFPVKCIRDVHPKYIK